MYMVMSSVIHFDTVILISFYITKQLDHPTCNLMCFWPVYEITFYFYLQVDLGVKELSLFIIVVRTKRVLILLHQNKKRTRSKSKILTLEIVTMIHGEVNNVFKMKHTSCTT